MGNVAWMVGSLILMPVFRQLPQAWTASWIDVVEPSWPYVAGFEPCKRLGDIIKVVSPGGLYMNFANAEAVSQICDRRRDFQKPTEVYEILAVFGHNVVTTEGHVWREHRKATAQAFSETNNALVWEESLHQAQAMMTAWASESTKNSVEDMTVNQLQSSTETLSLHIISKAGFGVRLFWPWEHGDVSKTNGLAQSSIETVTVGHRMTFKIALRTMLENVLWLAAVPPWLLRILPFQTTRKTLEAKAECGRYWEELLKQKTSEVRSGTTESESSMDLMYLLVKAAGIASSDKAETDTESNALSAADIIGNAFVFTIAGHETTADSIHYIILNLAMNRSAQSHLQNDLDLILGDKKDWDYFEDFDRLFGSMLGAVIYEGLGLMPPVILVPKTVRVEDQVLTVDGNPVVVPRGTFIHLNVFALHRNPRYWPHRPSKRTNAPSDLNDYIPERWLPGYQSYGNSRSQNKEEEGTGSQRSPNDLFTPTRGAFLPFSEGHRSCLGRRFALVELVAVLAVISKSYSVELAVDEWASDERVDKMTKAEREALYTSAVNTAYRKLERGCESIITLKLKKGNEVPVRFVKRGKERFPLEE